MEYKTSVELFLISEYFVVFHSSTLNLKLHERTSILHNLISVPNCTEIEKLLLLSVVGHTG